MTDLNDADGIIGTPTENIDADERLNPFNEFLDNYYNCLDVCRGQGNPKVEENGLTLNLQFNPNEIYGAGHLVLDKTKVNELKDDEKLLLIVRRKLQRRREFGKTSTTGTDFYELRLYKDGVCYLMYRTESTPFSLNYHVRSLLNMRKIAYRDNEPKHFELAIDGVPVDLGDGMTIDGVPVQD